MKILNKNRYNGLLNHPLISNTEQKILLETESVLNIKSWLTKNIHLFSINDKNRIFQILRKRYLKNQESDIGALLKILKITKFHSIRFYLQDAFSLSSSIEGKLQIYLGFEEVFNNPIHAKWIGINNFTKETESEKLLDKPIVTTGCGCVGCCPGLF